MCFTVLWYVLIIINSPLLFSLVSFHHLHHQRGAPALFLSHVSFREMYVGGGGLLAGGICITAPSDK